MWQGFPAPLNALNPFAVDSRLRCATFFFSSLILCTLQGNESPHIFLTLPHDATHAHTSLPRPRPFPLSPERSFHGLSRSAVSGSPAVCLNRDIKTLHHFRVRSSGGLSTGRAKSKAGRGTARRITVACAVA